MPRKPPPPGDVRYTLGRLIQDRRLSRGLSQRDLASLIGKSVSSVQQYELGMHEPPIEAMLRIAHACDMPLSALISPLDTVRLAPLEPERAPPRRRPRKAS